MFSLIGLNDFPSAFFILNISILDPIIATLQAPSAVDSILSG
jgi:hypothetical protein